MKLIQIGTNLINLDKVIFVDISNLSIYLVDGNVLGITEPELDMFIHKYNEINTNHFETSIEILADALSRNSDLMIKRQLEEQVIIAVRLNNLEDYFKEISEGTKLQDLSITKLVEVHRLIKTKVQSNHLDLEF